MKETEVLAKIANGETAYELLDRADPEIESRFRRLDKSLVKLLKDVRIHFPDAIYYTAGGGFNLLLGNSHGYPDNPQRELEALSGQARIGDGDW